LTDLLAIQLATSIVEVFLTIGRLILTLYAKLDECSLICCKKCYWYVWQILLHWCLELLGSFLPHASYWCSTPKSCSAW